MNTKVFKKTENYKSSKFIPLPSYFLASGAARRQLYTFKNNQEAGKVQITVEESKRQPPCLSQASHFVLFFLLMFKVPLGFLQI